MQDKNYVLLTKLPRPDHPTERKLSLVRVDMIVGVDDDEYNYEPDAKAPVAIPKNSPLLRGPCTAVILATGRVVVVKEPVAEVWAKIAAAREGAPPITAAEATRAPTLAL